MSAKFIAFASALLWNASLLQADSACRPLNSFEQGSDLRLGQRVAGYNATARIDVRGSWDIYAAGKYLFWQPREGNLEIGILNLPSSSGTILDGRIIDMNYHYKSGVKAGLGVYSSWDNWDVYGEYTWFTSHQYGSAVAGDGSIIPLWIQPFNFPTTLMTLGKSRWDLELNIADLQLARCYFVGSKLAFRPYFAARAAWINQHYHINYLPMESTTPYHIHNSSHSWGVGPSTGISTEWQLGAGVHVVGSAEADILFTRYNVHSTEQQWNDPTVNAISLYHRHLIYLQPHSDLEMGLGWETYFNNHNYHLNLLATYGFQVFWNQNVFRDSMRGDLYIHGLTAQKRFDF